MFDDLRNAAEFTEEDPDQIQSANAGTTRHTAKSATFLGMNAVQRFVLSLLIFFIVCILGSIALVLTQSIVLPF